MDKPKLEVGEKVSIDPLFFKTSKVLIPLLQKIFTIKSIVYQQSGIVLVFFDKPYAITRRGVSHYAINIEYCIKVSNSFNTFYDKSYE